MTRLRLEVPQRRGQQIDVTPQLGGVRGLAAAGHRQVPLAHTYIADCETPVSAYLKLRDGGPAFLLESVEHGRLGRHSMIGIRPQAVVRGAAGRLVVSGADGERELDASDPFGAVEDVVDGVGMAPPPQPLEFSGGAVGFFGYDLVRTVERLPGEPPDDRGLPDLIALVTGPVVVFDHLRRALTIVAPCPLEEDDDEQEAAYWRTVATIAELKGRLSGPLPRPSAPAGDPVLGPVTSNMSREAFEAAVERCREYIFAGDAFQIVPSQRFSAPMSLDPFAVYRGLRTVNPSPYMFFFETGEVTLVGSSPEMLVKRRGRHGRDAPHRRQPAARRRRAGGRAPGRGAAGRPEGAGRARHARGPGPQRPGPRREIGTVQLTDLMDVSATATSCTSCSTVTGRLAAGQTAFDALRATLPRRDPVRRAQGAGDGDHRRAGAAPRAGRTAAPWASSDFSGNMDTCITMRTIVCKDGMAHVQAGRRDRGRHGRRDRVRGDPEQGGRALPGDRGRRRPGRVVSGWPPPRPASR